MIKLVKKIIQNFFDNSGYKVVVKDKFFEKDFLEIYSKCKPYTMTSQERMYSLYKPVEHIIKSNIPGDFVECGVWRGGSAMLIAYTLKNLGITNRKIYLYDTYEGMSSPTKEDRTPYKNDIALEMKNSKKNDKKWLFSSLDAVKRNMLSTGYPSQNIIFVKGKIEETIPKTIPKKISLLRLDTDWYESTKHELKNLYPLLVKKGIMIVDDYGHWTGSKKAVDEYFEKKPILLNRIDYSGRISIK